MTDDRVACTAQPEAEFADRDPRSRCGLAGHGKIGIRRHEFPLKRDESAHRENDGARARCLDRGAQAARAGISQRRHLDHTATATALREATGALRPREGELPWAKTPRVAGSDHPAHVHRIDPPEIVLRRAQIRNRLFRGRRLTE